MQSFELGASCSKLRRCVSEEMDDITVVCVSFLSNLGLLPPGIKLGAGDSNNNNSNKITVNFRYQERAQIMNSVYRALCHVPRESTDP